MTGPTHKRCSVTFACIALMIMYSCGICTLDFSSKGVNYFLALLIMLPISKIGAKEPDVDQDWEFVKDKTVPNLILNKLIHITGGGHRSRHTHSIDVVALLTIASVVIPNILLSKCLITLVNKEIMQLIAIAFMSGWLSHIVADMMNGAGVYLFFWGKWKLAFVPKKIFKFRFKTGEAWEKFVYFTVHKINIVLGIVTLTYPWMGLKVLKLMKDMIIILIERIGDMI